MIADCKEITKPTLFLGLKAAASARFSHYFVWLKIKCERTAENYELLTFITELPSFLKK